REWAGTRVRIPHPADAFLLGLAVNRLHGDEFGGLKPSDAEDARLLLEQPGMSLERLEERARHLGCARTLATFMRWLRRSSANAPYRPSALERLIARLRCVGECGYLPRLIPLIRLSRAPALLIDMVRAAPDIQHARRALSGSTDIRTTLASLAPAQPVGQSHIRERRRIIRAIRWAYRLLPLGPAAGDCLPRAVATWAALRRRGWDVTLVTGVARSGSADGGHAWVEDAPGQIIPEWGEPVNTIRFAETFRWPPTSLSSRDRVTDPRRARAARAPAA
ncbi:MAG: lasso peptide biosynthesis B2 protein, partial [Gemmatimonadales bacterium]